MFKASDIKELREKTGAGMLDCKKALEENNGEIEKAIDWLREKGIAKAAKKEGRIAAEGVCTIKEDDKSIVIVEVNTETDFVAKNDEFVDFVDRLTDNILNNDVTDVASVMSIKDNEQTLEEELTALVARIGEKIDFRRFVKLAKKENQTFGSYIHMGGKIGTVIVLDGADEAVAKDVAMHAAAMNPTAIRREDLSEDVVTREANIIKEQVMSEGKPEEIAEKMVAGRLNKFYKEICLEEQAFIKDSGMDVKTYVADNKGTIVEMIRFAVGEGIEKKEENFAEEVMSQING